MVQVQKLYVHDKALREKLKTGTVFAVIHNGHVVEGGQQDGLFTSQKRAEAFAKQFE